MKATIEVSVVKPNYVPKVITITLESMEEELGFHHLYGCRFKNPNCTSSKEVESIQWKLEKELGCKLRHKEE